MRIIPLSHPFPQFTHSLTFWLAFWLTHPPTCYRCPQAVTVIGIIENATHPVVHRNLEHLLAIRSIPKLNLYCSSMWMVYRLLTILSPVVRKWLFQLFKCLQQIFCYLMLYLQQLDYIDNKQGFGSDLILTVCNLLGQTGTGSIIFSRPNPDPGQKLDPDPSPSVLKTF